MTLKRVCERGDAKKLRLLLDKGVDVNERYKRDRTALMVASERGNAEVVQTLLSVPDIEINAKEKVFGNTALILACKKGCVKTTRILLEDKRTSVNQGNDHGSTPLMAACDFVKDDDPKKEEIIKLLLKHPKMEVNKKNNLGCSALMLASDSGKLDSLKLLIESKDIDINITDRNGNTILIMLFTGTRIEKCHNGG